MHLLAFLLKFTESSLFFVFLTGYVYFVLTARCTRAYLLCTFGDVFRGGMVPWPPPPLGRQYRKINIEYHVKLRHGPPLCNLGRKFEHKNGLNVIKELFCLRFWSLPTCRPKTRPNLRQDLFFWSSPNFGQKNELILSGEIFHLVCIIHKFPAPPFKNPAYATVYIVQLRVFLVNCVVFICNYILW